jgi:hypothetical protein
MSSKLLRAESTSNLNWTGEYDIERRQLQQIVKLRHRIRHRTMSRPEPVKGAAF